MRALIDQYLLTHAVKTLPEEPSQETATYISLFFYFVTSGDVPHSMSADSAADVIAADASSAPGVFTDDTRVRATHVVASSDAHFANSLKVALELPTRFAVGSASVSSIRRRRSSVARRSSMFLVRSCCFFLMEHKLLRVGPPEQIKLVASVSRGHSSRFADIRSGLKK